MPVHMRYLPPLPHTGSAQDTPALASAGYTEVSIPPPTVAINCGAQLNAELGRRAETGTETETGTQRDGDTEGAGAGSTAMHGSGWSPVTVVYADEAAINPPLSGVGEASAAGTQRGSDGVVSAEIPAGQLAHAALVWYGTLGATLFAALAVVAIS